MTQARPVRRARSAMRVFAVDGDGIEVADGGDRPIDVLFDGHRIWSFWLVRDTESGARGRRYARWPAVLRKFLDGITVLTIREHGSSEPAFEQEVSFGTATSRIEVVDRSGHPLGIDKAGKLVPTFENRTSAHTAPLLDSLETVLGELQDAGLAAFPAYGTLLGAVREGRLIGHDSDADIGYVSEHQHPYDVIRESFDLQRRLLRSGFETRRYSGASLIVLVPEADGYVRGLDIFGGYLDGHRLNLMGEVRTPYRPEWIFPLGTCTLEGRTLPAPAEPERLLEAMYGPQWRVPDPAFEFATPDSTIQAFNALFRVTRARRRQWARVHARKRPRLRPIKPSPLARLVRRRHGIPERLLDVGAGRALDSLWFARRGAAVTAYDYLPSAMAPAARRAAREERDFEARRLNLQEWRSVFAEGARASRIDGPKVMLARHILDATPRFGREALARFASMSLRGGGWFYADFWCGGGRPGRGTRVMSPVSLDEVGELLTGAGAEITSLKELRVDAAAQRSRRTGRVVARWR